MRLVKACKRFEKKKQELKNKHSLIMRCVASYCANEITYYYDAITLRMLTLVLS